MLARTFTALREALTQRHTGGTRKTGKDSRTLGVEALEDRRLLALTDLAAISGFVFVDATDNGYDPGEGVAGATVNLYTSDGDTQFEPNFGDAFAGSATTDGSGLYRFDRLGAGTYLVVQPEQTVGIRQLDQLVSGNIVITAADASGKAGIPIDTFSQTHQAVTAKSANGNNPDYLPKQVANGEAIGGERDLYALLTSGDGEISLEALAYGVPVLQFDSSSAVAGTRIVSWDGVDNDALNLNKTGLGGLDLTEAGNNAAIELVVGADQDNGAVIIRVYSDANHWSQIQAPIPNTQGMATERVTLEFDDFQTGLGASGAANFGSVGAVEMEIIGAQLSVDGRLEAIGTRGHNVLTQDFSNGQIADVSLEKSVDNPSPNIDENVTFTIVVTNDGPDNVTGIEVRDALPPGLGFLAAFESKGAYNNSTGIWTVGDLNVGASATLRITASVDTPGTKTNIAQVSAADQEDIDSVPNNNVPGEDDQDDAQVTPRVADLSLTKSVDRPIVNVGEIVTFTLDLTNSGPDVAHNVTVIDVLPSGLSYVSTNGPYNPATGVWTVGTLGVQQTTSLQIRAEVMSLGTKVNDAEVAMVDEYDPDSTPNNHDPNEDDQDDAQVTALQIDLSVVKDVDDPTPHVGDNVTFTITVSNAGPDAATNVALGDTLPAGLSYVSDNGQGAYNSGTGTWTVGTLPVGGSASLQITAQVTTGGVHTNIAQVTAADQYDPDSTPANNVPSEDDQDDATVTPRAAVAGTVYYDANNDGVLGTGDTGIAGVAIRLSGTDSQGNAVNRTTTTGADGSYLFDNLPPSSAAGYQIAESQPGDYLDNKETVGSLGGQAAVPSSEDRFVQVVVTSGANGAGYNFGEIKGGSISGHVYYDRNRNGTKQDNEPGILGTMIALTGIDDLGNQVYLTTTTDSNGFYLFDNLRPSNAQGYHLEETQPGGYRDGQESRGTFNRPDGQGSLGTSNLTLQVLDDAFAGLNLPPGVHAMDFNFGELSTFVSKIMFMASGK